MENGSIFENQYRIIRNLGEGGMGSVYLAQDVHDGTYWAIKEAVRTEKNSELLISEADILGRLSHPALPMLRGRLIKEPYFYIIMEFIDGRTLKDIIKEGKALDESLIVDWFIQICRVLVYLHGLEHPVVYRDFKPSNIMLDHDGRIRIIDFGIAQEYQGGRANVNMVALTRGYAAPEQYSKRYSLDVRTDIYAVAVTMHYLLTGKDPNQPPYHFKPVRKLRKNASLAIEYIVKKCLQPNPNKRYPNAALLLNELEHISELEKKLKFNVRRKRLLAVATAVLAAAVSFAAYFASYRVRKDRIEQYYDYMKLAENTTTAEEAQAALECAIALSPDNPEAYIALAEFYLKYDRPADAVDYINEEIITRFPDIYSNADFQRLVEEIEGNSGE